MRLFFFGFLVLCISGISIPKHVRGEFLTLYDFLKGTSNFSGLSFGVFAFASLEDVILSSIGGFGAIQFKSNSILYNDGRPSAISFVVPGGGFKIGYDLTYLPYDLGMDRIPTVLGWWSGLQVGVAFDVIIPVNSPNATLLMSTGTQFPELGVLDNEVNVDGVTYPAGTPRLSMTLTEEIRLSILGRLGIISFDYFSVFGLFGYNYSKGAYSVVIPVSAVERDFGGSEPLTLGVVRPGPSPLRRLDFPVEFHGVSYGGGAEIYLHRNLSFRMTALHTFYPTIINEETFILTYFPKFTKAPVPIFFIQRSSLLLKAEIVYRF